MSLSIGAFACGGGSGADSPEPNQEERPRQTIRIGSETLAALAEGETLVLERRLGTLYEFDMSHGDLDTTRIILLGPDGSQISVDAWIKNNPFGAPTGNFTLTSDPESFGTLSREAIAELDREGVYQPGEAGDPTEYARSASGLAAAPAPCKPKYRCYIVWYSCNWCGNP